MEGWLSWASVRCSADEALAPRGREPGVAQDLDRDRLPRSSRSREVDDAHAALAEHPEHAVRPERVPAGSRPPRHRRAALPATSATPRSSREPPRSSSSSSAATSAINVRVAPAWARRNACRSAAGRSAARVEELLDRVPARGVHRGWSGRPRGGSGAGQCARRSCRASQARAARQSRSTVASDTPSTSAVSATSRPPKKRHLDQCRLARLQPREVLERGVERQQVAGAGQDGARSASSNVTAATPAAALAGVPAPGRLDQHLAHGARGDPLEVQRARASRAAATGPA